MNRDQEALVRGLKALGWRRVDGYHPTFCKGGGYAEVHPTRDVRVSRLLQASEDGRSRMFDQIGYVGPFVERGWRERTFATVEALARSGLPTPALRILLDGLGGERPRLGLGWSRFYVAKDADDEERCVQLVEQGLLEDGFTWRTYNVTASGAQAVGVSLGAA